MLHLIGDVVHKTPFELHEFLCVWSDKHREFAENISSYILEWKNLKFDDYLSFICDTQPT